MKNTEKEPIGEKECPFCDRFGITDCPVCAGNLVYRENDGFSSEERDDEWED